MFISVVLEFLLPLEENLAAELVPLLDHWPQRRFLYWDSVQAAVKNSECSTSYMINDYDFRCL